jgi:biopolymer transport protein ExbD
MDVFTVLVFMLLINSSDGIQINDTRELKMPVSTASELPKENLLVMIVKNDILVQGIKVGEITAINDKQEIDLKGFNEELEHQAKRSPELTDEEKEFGRPVTIQADQKLPYSILKQIMASCAQAEFRNISLAVTQVAGEH